MKIKQIPRVWLLALPLMFFMQSCYEDYKIDYEYTSTYFAMQSPLRTLVLEDGREPVMELGAMMGGKYVNDRDEIVGYEVQPALLDEHPQLTLLPEAYYELSNPSEMVIPEGEMLGRVTLTMNDNFFQDDSAHILHYALPLQITSSTTDSILTGKDWTIIAIKYHNKFYGAYWLKGVDYTLDSIDAGNPPVDTFAYSQADLVKNYFVTFDTRSIDTCLVPYMGPDISGNNSMKIAVNENGSVDVLPEMLSDVSALFGGGSYEEAERTFFLDYSYEKGGMTHLVYDTLIYFATPMEVEIWQ